SQARQHHAAPRRQRRPDRLRPLQGPGARARPHRQRHHLRHAALHEPGAGPRRAARCAQRPLQPRRHPLRDAHRPEALPRREPDGDRLQAPQGADPAAAGAVRGRAAAPRAAAGEDAGGSHRYGGGGGGGAAAHARCVAGARDLGMSAAAAPAPAAADRASILEAPTPPAWVEDALSHLPELLLDHANCEKKAASSALALMFAYAEDTRLALALSRLAREELRHFEQVQKALAPHVPPPLERLYEELSASEARHFELYIDFARTAAPQEWRSRLEALASREAQLATTADRLLRFHSGPLERAPEL